MNPLPGQLSFLDNPPKFGGTTYDPKRDHDRLSGALGRVYQYMSDSAWHTIEEIAREVGCSEAGASARLRDLRKEKFRERFPNRGVERENIGGGLWRYRLLP
jgi:hypothetical protein